MKEKLDMLKVLLLLITLSTTCSANDREKNILNDRSIYQQIIENRPDAILCYQENKLYLRSEKLSLTDHGIFLGNITIPLLLSDSTGCYVDSRSSRWICCTRGCSNFRNIFHNSDGICPYCHRKGLSDDF